MSITITIITLNEERSLPQCLSSVQVLADDIVVVDCGSVDRTVEIAKKYKARVFYRKFDNFANQKNYALSKVNSDWVLSLDADEEIEPELVAEIKQEIVSSKYVAYTIPRKNIILGKFIRFTRWQPELDRHVWLWKNTFGKWIGDVHEEVEVVGKVGKLKHAKIHNQYKNVFDFFEMMNSYSELGAEKHVTKGEPFSYFKLFSQPIYNFLVRYFYRLGFLDGWRGFVLSYLMTIYHFQLGVKIWEKTHV